MRKTPNATARALRTPLFRARTERDRKAATKRGYSKHKGRP